MTGERHLVLGGCGFIGRNVVRHLVAAGHAVTVADRVPFQDDQQVAPIAFEVLELGTADWDRLLEGVDVVHHYVWASTPASANADPGRDLDINVGTTIALLDALRRRGGGRLVFSSSGGTVYGRIRHVPVAEDHPIAPITAYGTGKATAELYLGLYRDMYGIDCRIARIANPFGGNQSLVSGVGAVTTFIHRALAGDTIEIWGDGTVVRDYIFIDDVARCLTVLATRPSVDRFIYNIGSGGGLSLNDIVTELETQVGHPLRVNRTPRRSFDVPISVLSIERAKQDLGWEPAYPFRIGVERTLSALRRSHEPS
ncbi:NAD-dependent epimerase/dehydratase family protein [Lichenihabitans sp. Uapishka_5]|uniref:NAD-dependent epimerase/dehydratase family protein n=1 Tax=Lichenihabitans sp. Uapishka_5 TaxID=3037302 RepID=UPI0029E7EB58|nr:NAD-dependent epimerase/dehydratase family protein [Lichenihabitans sp. Uapishka_5]MDX7952946.1 NAD-dependent epimerase/dehydratase family protein [Lichenihabitans sp. Uapishka_5]